ncbi:MAG TPA: LytTR family DNA-binding domain-containing protein [Chryseolinea sp.]|nr:LytTR family DNA-binding domain-containing protein [Chryseolinea sp.]
MKDTKRHTSEIKLFLLLIPLINVFNYYLTYNNISLSWRTLLTFSIDTLEGYAAWAAVHFIILYLDRRMPFHENVLKRLIVQIVTTLFIGMFIIVALTVIIHYAFTDRPMPGSFFFYDIFIISVWFLVINGIYIALHFYNQWRISESNRVEENKIKKGGLNVKSGKQELFLNYGDIAGFSVDDDYIICYTVDGKKFLLDQSMDKLEKALPTSSFFRLNRQTLIHRQIVSGFKKGVNGKLDILIKSLSAISSPLNVSRTRASSFKTWFQAG